MSGLRMDLERESEVYGTRDEHSGISSRRAMSILPKLSRMPSRLGENEGEKNISGSLMERASSRRTRPSTLPRKRPETSWLDDVDCDLSSTSYQRQESFLVRFKKMKLVQHGGEENENPEDIGSVNFKGGVTSSLRKSRRKPLRLDFEDLLTEEQISKLGFKFGNKDLDLGFSLKRRALSNVKQYISTIRIPESEQTWSLILNAVDLSCLRNRKMEAPGSGEYTNFVKLRDLYGHQGIFRCRGCRSFLFSPKDFVDETLPWATFRKALPNAITVELEEVRGKIRHSALCTHCCSFVGRQDVAKGIYACSRSIHYHPMSKDEVDIIVKACHRRGNRAAENSVAAGALPTRRPHDEAMGSERSRAPNLSNFHSLTRTFR
eukprot:Plantae.Rhodophyta-Purpureofilum_apyrenoidigerum.ctg29870.p1 GENE.Plantae.Rhodophyta-Purpureofilum_apyrenoidigerum.ctg29870~~Plantae.Rhodophyta-Purpureofilum_apyrenoidigerum.ctg29870.p1  ORF type:complete len:377 (-),score=51.49 Plantae.Rhodophyta-Purpureofilum_apyrenoidigerum.ctg29870:165-1295(-)